MAIVNDMRNWRDLYESYESRLHESFEDTGNVIISNIEFYNENDSEYGTMIVHFDNIESNSDWGDEGFDDDIPYFIDEQGLYKEINKILNHMGYKHAVNQFEPADMSFAGDSMSFDTYPEFTKEIKRLKMQQRFKR